MFDALVGARKDAGAPWHLWEGAKHLLRRVRLHTTNRFQLVRLKGKYEPRVTLADHSFVDVNRALCQEHHRYSMMPADAHALADDLLTRTSFTFRNKKMRLVDHRDVGRKMPLQ